jgi:hypothetical protein
MMIGSVYIMNMETRAEVDDWLKIEPYMTGDVWRRLEINYCRVGPSFVDLKLQSRI